MCRSTGRCARASRCAPGRGCCECTPRSALLHLHRIAREQGAQPADGLAGALIVRRDVIDDRAQLLDVRALLDHFLLRSARVEQNCGKRLADLVRERATELAQRRRAGQVSELLALGTLLDLEVLVLRGVDAYADHRLAVAVALHLAKHAYPAQPPIAVESALHFVGSALLARRAHCREHAVAIITMHALEQPIQRVGALRDDLARVSGQPPADSVAAHVPLPGTHVRGPECHIQPRFAAQRHGSGPVQFGERGSEQHQRGCRDDQEDLQRQHRSLRPGRGERSRAMQSAGNGQVRDDRNRRSDSADTGSQRGPDQEGERRIDEQHGIVRGPGLMKYNQGNGADRDHDRCSFDPAARLALRSKAGVSRTR